MAVLCDRCHLLEKLLKAGGNDSFSSWQNGYLPIHVAAWKECLNCLKMLVNNTRSNTSAPSSTVLCDITSVSQSILDSWHHHHKVLNSEVSFFSNICIYARKKGLKVSFPEKVHSAFKACFGGLRINKNIQNKKQNSKNGERKLLYFSCVPFVYFEKNLRASLYESAPYMVSPIYSQMELTSNAHECLHSMRLFIYILILVINKMLCSFRGMFLCSRV